MNRTTDAPPALFASFTNFQSGFEAGLRRMLDTPTLGAFILVLANASFDAAMYPRFRPMLMQAFGRWCRRFDTADPQAVAAPVDDRAVFARLRATGLHRLGTTQWRSVGPWRCQFNPLRAFRPPRMSDAVIRQLHRPFDTAAFHFDKPFLRPEIFWEGDVCGHAVRLLYNKFPFAERHGLLVPEPSAQRPQYLDATMVTLIWRLAEQFGATLPGIGFGYNAYGAYCSVNHLHFQQFVGLHDRYPIEADSWDHNGGLRRYPLAVTVIDNAAAAWRHIARLQRHDRAFNLLFRPSRVYVVDRALQGSYRHSEWTGGFAWAEVAGVVTLFDAAAFAELNERALNDEFARLAVVR